MRIRIRIRIRPALTAAGRVRMRLSPTTVAAATCCHPEPSGMSTANCSTRWPWWPSSPSRMRPKVTVPGSSAAKVPVVAASGGDQMVVTGACISLSCPYVASTAARKAARKAVSEATSVSSMRPFTAGGTLTRSTALRPTGCS
ncbi:hypothetical protein NGB36_04390 [Streptomyces sp. RB6PN25]|uniref:Uncharacterized protein n=1 Tax=Streptomyces humicola TaxID=2953240 RepID=A0ABT1PTH6_9ACTN|nr:hypothetical protein [Streptomyces humicola]MCQ4079850.1 hypothetical protein [Streptomyces humicola]